VTQAVDSRVGSGLDCPASGTANNALTREVEMTTLDQARYFGVDLAWGQRARTGLAVLDDAGRPLESASVRTDHEILAFVDRHVSDTLVAAVDAPLVVPNESGRRSCEALVGQLFARFGAGAYPANRGNPNFRPEPRDARLAAEMGWDMDPSTPPGIGRRVCIEVYPHPAMVSLFPLDHVIPYKIKPGRDLPALKKAYRQLLSHLEGTCGPVLALADSARWSALCSTAAGAARKSELDAIEDEIDAIFCAYLAWLWGTDREGMVVLGDYATGYIVTPTPPRPTALHGRPVWS
jgi:predicted RNase H-like nuclease